MSASESLLSHVFIEKYTAALHTSDLKIIFHKKVGKIYFQTCTRFYRKM